jgi:hypothetical protein
LASVTGTPDPPWLYAYQLPTDVKFLRVVTVYGYPIDYEQQLNKLLCNYDTSVDVIAKYTWNVPEAYWPADFAEAITQHARGAVPARRRGALRGGRGPGQGRDAHPAGGQDGRPRRRPRATRSSPARSRRGAAPPIATLPWR